MHEAYNCVAILVMFFYAFRTTTLPGTVTLTSLWSGESSKSLQHSSSESDIEADVVVPEIVEDEPLESEDEITSSTAVVQDETSNSTDTEQEDIIDEGVVVLSKRKPKQGVHLKGRSKQGEQEDNNVIDEGVIVHSKRKPKRGSTANYTFFHLDRTPSLKMFQSYLMSLDGGERGQDLSRWHASKLSKFLYFASQCTRVNWMAIKDADKLKAYLKKMTIDGINVGGQMEVLASIRHGIQFCLLEGDMSDSIKNELTTMHERLTLHKKICFLLQDCKRKCDGNLICPDMPFHKEMSKFQVPFLLQGGIV